MIANAKYASFVIDFETGEILHSVNADTRNYPASLTKMMTLYLVFEKLKKQQWSLQKKLQVSRRAARQPASKLGLRPGQLISVKNAILAIVTKSANDVATLLAENIAGSERNFALLMTKKARQIGMKRTTFRNASGLPHRGQLSTARDMSLLAQRLLQDFPRYYYFFSTAYFNYQGRKFRNHNKLLKSYSGVDGFKTGYIRASGYNLVASAKRGKRRVIGVLFGSNSAKQRNYHMKRLLDKGFVKANTTLAINNKTQKSIVKSRKRNKRKNQLFSWGIQVGAFAKAFHAKNAAHKAFLRATKYISQGEIQISPLKKKSGRYLYRARIIGISKKSAYKACKLIKDCMELKIPIHREVASR